jgi:hypothetical protein
MAGSSPAMTAHSATLIGFALADFVRSGIRAMRAPALEEARAWARFSPLPAPERGWA